MNMEYQKCMVVSEIACNHQGNMGVAKEMIKVSKLCGADYIKFQKRNPKKAIPQYMQNKPHPCPMHAFGETYLAHRMFLEFDIEQHKMLQEYCNQVGIGYVSSVWDEDSAREIISLCPDFIKVPSAMNENYYLLDTLFNEFDKDIHISLGMLQHSEKYRLFKYLEDKKERVVLYHTTSGYPVKFEELFLLEISEILKSFPRVGFSGHHLGISIDIAAYTLGATWIERHFTLDRTSKGSDHSASLEPTGLQKVCRDLMAAYKSLKFKENGLTEDEIKNREKLKIMKLKSEK
jgi:N-acetylneuraminate synthase